MGLSDIKLYALNGLALSFTLTNIVPLLEVVLLLLTIGYTLMRIFTHLKGTTKNKK
jgi:hypothetical protein